MLQQQYEHTLRLRSSYHASEGTSFESRTFVATTIDSDGSIAKPAHGQAHRHVSNKDFDHYKIYTHMHTHTHTHTHMYTHMHTHTRTRTRTHTQER